MTQEEIKNDLLIAVSEIVEAISKIGSDENTTEHLSVVKSRSKRLLKNASNMLDVETPEFRVGDVVASTVFGDGSFSFVQLNEDLINLLTLVNGLWYTKDECAIGDMSLGVFKKDTRHATPEEIAEYEAALNFHKHGRELFEVKKGDLVRTPGGNNTFIWNPEYYKKEEFMDCGFEFLKTAEEIDEWLGADDDK